MINGKQITRVISSPNDRSLVNVNEFEPIIQLIEDLSYTPAQDSLYLVVYIPNGFIIDDAKITSVFENDAELVFDRNHGCRLKGTIINKELVQFIMRLWYEKHK